MSFLSTAPHSLAALGAALALSAVPGGPAAAQTAQGRPDGSAHARLIAPPAETRFILDGRVWNCDGQACLSRSGAAAHSQPAARECRRFVSRMGPVEQYRTRGTALSEADVTTCNMAATQR